MRTKLFSEHAGRCSPAATAAVLVSPCGATFSARSRAPPPRSRASGRPPSPAPGFSGLGLGVSPLCFVRESLFFQGTTNLGGELPCGPPGEAAHGGETIRGAARSMLCSTSPSKSSRPRWTPAGESAREPRSSGGSDCPEAEEELLLPVRNALLFWALAAAAVEGQGPGPEPGARRTEWVHGAGAIGVGFSPAWRVRAGPSGVCGLCRLPASGTAEREDLGALSPRCPPATSRLQPPPRTWLEGQRGKKGKIKRKKGGQ